MGGEWGSNNNGFIPPVRSYLVMASLLSFSFPKAFVTRASSSITATDTASFPETLHEKFGRKGIAFFESADVPTVELTVRNGSSLKLEIPNGHVTSYKPKVYWKDNGFEEVLYALPPKGTGAGSTNAKGGIGLVINESSEQNSKVSALKNSEWTVKDVDSDSIDAVQVVFHSTVSLVLEIVCVFLVILIPIVKL